MNELEIYASDGNTCGTFSFNLLSRVHHNLCKYIYAYIPTSKLKKFKMTVFVKNIKGPVHDISNLETVGSYSIDGNKRYRNDLSQLKYYKKPRNCNRVYFDLNEGTVYESAEDLKIDFLLKWILENLDRLKVEDLENPTRWLKPEFICSRGFLKKLLRTTFDECDDWTFCASKFKGTIYLSNCETDDERSPELNANNFIKRTWAWGHKYQQYILSRTPHTDPDISFPVNLNEKFCCVFQSKLGTVNLLYNAVVDGIDSQEIVQDTVADKKLEFVELKTVFYKHFTHDKLNRTITKQRLWTQSYPVGIRNIICGLKNGDGIVERVVELDMNSSNDDIKMNQDRSKSFCSGFLEYIRQIVTKEHNECVYKFTFLPEKGTVAVETIEPPGSKDIFLRSWYINGVEEYFANF